jgi:hypothetical protein
MESYQFTLSSTLIAVVMALSSTNFAGLKPSSDSSIATFVTPATPVTRQSATMPAASLWTVRRFLFVDGRCGAFYRPRTTVSYSSAVVAMLLLMSGVESNPGPIVAVASLNANSIVRKGPLIRDVVETHQLDLLAVCETWIADDDPDAVKLDAVPAGFRVTHQPRPTATINKRGGGLCVIHRDSLIVKQHPLQQRLRCRTFECQLLTVSVGGASRDTVVVANIYRPPETNPQSFYDELSDLLSNFGDCIDNDRFVVCGDFNCGGADPVSIDSDLQSVLDVHGLRQLVTTPTRQTPTTSSLLDLVIGSALGSGRISSVTVKPSHGISDHDLVTWSLSSRHKTLRPTHTYQFRNIKSMDLYRFKRDVIRSELFTGSCGVSGRIRRSN